MNRCRRRWRVSGRERGFAAIELSAGIALLVLPVALLVLTLPEWSTRQGVARLAARDGARAVALTGRCDPGVGDRATASIAAGAGLPEDAVRVVVDCVAGTALPRGGDVTVRVTVRMPAIAVPLIGSVAAWSWTAVHREPVDPYGSRP
jgi:hypothetical protein